MGCDCDTQIGPWTPESLEGVDLVIIPLASIDLHFSSLRSQPWSPSSIEVVG
jgi:hypothetical protein